MSQKSSKHKQNKGDIEKNWQHTFATIANNISHHPLLKPSHRLFLGGVPTWLNAAGVAEWCHYNTGHWPTTCQLKATKDATLGVAFVGYTGLQIATQCLNLMQASPSTYGVRVTCKWSNDTLQRTSNQPAPSTSSPGSARMAMDAGAQVQTSSVAAGARGSDFPCHCCAAGGSNFPCGC